MRRRDFIKVIAGTAAAWPLAAHAQGNSLPIVGFLNPRSQSRGATVAAAFRDGLHDAGYEEGRNAAIEYRWAEDQNERLPALAGDLVARGVSVIVAGGGAWVAAKSVTSSIPIVFTTGLDPVRVGIVKSLSRPEANLTGVTFYSGGALFAKQIELLRVLVPNVKRLTFFAGITPTTESQVQDAQAAALMNGVGLAVVRVANVPDLDAAFAATQADGMLFAVDPFFDSRASDVVIGAERQRVPAMYYIREFVEVGGLVSYGSSIRDTYRQAGSYAGRILAGAKPADLPVVLPTKFELVLNLKTARALRLNVPDKMLALTDEVID
jgi:putative tryptophan/tyrosine transport system substrate-binding protein